MHEKFAVAYKAQLDKKRENLSPEQYSQYERFALNNRERAREFIKQIMKDTNFNFAGKRVLDIGCAYGGFLIESAALGAEVHGVEILPDLVRLAQINIENEAGNISLYEGDILDCNLLRGEKFDLIIINDVFEHIFDVEHLFNRIAELSSDSAICFFAIPNAESFHSILKEGHKFIFGLSLLEPGYWGTVVGNFNIYYRPINLYRYYFERAGYCNMCCRCDKQSGVFLRITEKYQEIENILSNNPFKNKSITEHAISRFKNLQLKFQRDSKLLDEAALHIKYEQHFWVGYATKKQIDNPSCLTTISEKL
jgi:2-polyprenyl-3-methyl-5-hydroxy-6-metoxy-1,4-benzoquinol methylase